MVIYLYVKTHNITGLKYLGKTTSKNPHKYTGSGTQWKQHLNEYGVNYSTEILRECTDNRDLREWGIYYSELWNVVGSNNWANCVMETGSGVNQTTESLRKQKETKIKNNTVSAGVNSMRDPIIQKKAGINSRKRYQFISPVGDVIDVTGLAAFCKENGLDQGNMSSIAHKKKNLKTHKGWSCSLI